jgi:hypothetical protein
MPTGWSNATPLRLPWRRIWAQSCDEVSGVAPILYFQRPLVELLVDLPQVPLDRASTVHWLAQESAHNHCVGVDLLVLKVRSPAFQRLTRLWANSTFSCDKARQYLD